MKSYYMLLVLCFLTSLCRCQLKSTGIQHDKDARANGFVVYTSRVVIPFETRAVYPRWGHLQSLAIQAYWDMIRDCRENGFISDCPGAMSVFAHERELHFGSSAKNLRTRQLTTPNYPFYYQFIQDKNLGSPTSPRVGTVGRLRLAMIQCQTQDIRVDVRTTNLDPQKHRHGGRCGEFTAVLSYLFTKEHPQSVDFGRGTDDPARVITVARRSETNLDEPPQVLGPCAVDNDPFRSYAFKSYGCKNWLERFGITSTYSTMGMQTVEDPDSRVEHVDLCDEFGIDDIPDDLMEGLDEGMEQDKR